MVLFFRQRSQLKHYECIACVNTKAPITALGLSPDGSLVGIGSAFGLGIYQGEAELSVPAYQPMFGAVAAIEWAPVEINDLVIFGTRTGWVFFLSNTKDTNVFLKTSEYRAAANGGVVCLNAIPISPSSLRVAAGMSSGIITIHEYDFKGYCKELYSFVVDDAIPPALIFEAAGAHLLLVGKDNGRMHRVQIENNQILSESHVSPNIGSAAFYGGHLVVDNTVDGFSLYQTDTAKLLHTFKTPRSVQSSAAQACFTGTGQWLVGGSDHGKVYVFDVQQPCVRDVIVHGSHELVSHVKASDFVGGHVIACAADTEVTARDGTHNLSLDRLKSSRVTVWKSTSPGSGRSPKIATRISVTGWMYRIVVFTCICSTGFNVFLYLQSVPFARNLIQGSMTFLNRGSHADANPKGITATTGIEHQIVHTHIPVAASSTTTSDPQVAIPLVKTPMVAIADEMHSHGNFHTKTITATATIESQVIYTRITVAAPPSATSDPQVVVPVVVPVVKTPMVVMAENERRDPAVISL